MNPIAEDILIHYGMPRRSGRYPWGSGENPYQHSGDFLNRVEELQKQGMKETEIARSMGFIDPHTGRTQTTKFRAQISLAKEERRSLLVDRAKSLREDGLSLNEIAREMGFKNDSSVRSLLNVNSEVRMNAARNAANFIKEQVDKKGLIDVGAGVERELGISKEKLQEALAILEMEGYPTYGGRVPQVTNKGKQTTLKIIGPPGTEHKDMYRYEDIHSLKDYVSHDDGETFDPKFVYPKSMDSKRMIVRYKEDGGELKDGVVEIRRGVPDLSLGESHYAQVRIMVDGTHYIKGMAVYSDDLPDGVDVLFNTNKSKGTPLEKVLKPIKENDPDNPFGSLIKEGVSDPKNPDAPKRGGQSYYYDKNGKKQLSLINKRAEEGDWGEWADKLPSQFLSKQNLKLIKKQLKITEDDKQAEFDEIKSLTNPTVKKKLLQSFADDCDAAAVHLKAAALPRQKYQVILPLTSIKDNEIYAPNYKDGETVALIRYPHGGTFEIPILKVNNKQPEGRKVLGTTPSDAVGINKHVADRLSGADFDGDTVMVIPCNSPGKVHITSTHQLKDLEGFDPKMSYGTVEKDGEYYNENGQKIRVMKNTQTEMGKVSNLITDMTLKGATEPELARAVKHSMVVIDAEKHKLDYKASEKENGIAALKKKYQPHEDNNGFGGAATLLSRSKSQVRVQKRKGSPQINKETGEVTWKEANETYVDKNGKVQRRMQVSTKMAETRDARTLSSGTPQEEAYADYANHMKTMANEARRIMMNTGKIAYSSTAKRTYQEEYDSLNAKLNIALKNAPKERQAQTIANSVVEAKKRANPDMKPAEVKKESQRALTAARASVGAKRTPVEITDREWEAIQAGAISENQLMKILNNTDIDAVRQRATPRTVNGLSQAKINRISALRASGYTTSQIASALGVSSSTVSKYLNQ